MPSGPRIRGNNSFGVTTDNPLTAGATSFNSPGLATLPVVSSAHAVVVLDPKRVFGAPEIVIVTSHTAAATVATITRAAYGTVARSHPQGTAWAHVPVDEDFIEILTSGTRPSDPYRGQAIFETDTNRYVGRSTADAWQDINLFADPPACSVFNNTTQSLTSGVAAVLQANSETFDTAALHDNVTNNGRITAPITGVYVFSATWGLAGDNDYVFFESNLRANGVTSVTRERNVNPGTSATARNFQIHGVYKLLATEYMEVVFSQQNTSANANNVDSFRFGACWLGRG